MSEVTYEAFSFDGENTMKLKFYFSIIAAVLLCTSHAATADTNIKQLQRKLTEFGFDAGVADGIWGKNTEAALNAFLATKGLTFDGKVDANEFALLGIQHSNVSSIKFNYNIHKSLPSDWVSEFEEIMNLLQNLLPIDEKFRRYVRNNSLEIYAWNGKIKNPFPEKKGMSGASISGDGRTRWMVLEIPENEFKYNHLHRYSVIVHEYFHIYQIGLSTDRMSPKWLVEGGAKVLEEMFVQQYYRRSSLEGDLKSPKLWSDHVFKNAHLYEKHETSSKETSSGWMDMNYAGSAFMVLALVNELQKEGITEHEAFELVFRDFWIEQSKQTNWKAAFQKTFKISVNDFYARLSKYKRKDARKILPRKSLKVQKIFN